MKQIIWIGMLSKISDLKISDLKLSDVENMNKSVKGEIINMFDVGWAIIGDDKAKSNFDSIRSVAETINTDKTKKEEKINDNYYSALDDNAVLSAKDLYDRYSSYKNLCINNNIKPYDLELFLHVLTTKLSHPTYLIHKIILDKGYKFGNRYKEKEIVL